MALLNFVEFLISKAKMLEVDGDKKIMKLITRISILTLTVITTNQETQTTSEFQMMKY